MPTEGGDLVFDDVRPWPFDFLRVEDLVSGGFTTWVRGLPPAERAAAAAFTVGWAHTEGKRVLKELAAERGPVDPAVEFVMDGPGAEVVPPDTTLESAMAELDRALDSLDRALGRNPSTYRFCTSCREREGDCHCSFLGKVPSWEARDAVTHEPEEPDLVEEWGLGSEVAELREHQRTTTADLCSHDPLDEEDCEWS